MAETEDFLEVDRQIPGQNYVCLSFISPEKVLKRKENFFMKEFLKHSLKENSFKTEESIDQDLDQKFDDFLYANEKALTTRFDEENDFQTNVRGVKVRGVYETVKEAQVRAKVLQKRDKNFHVFVCQVGYWLAWDPNPDQVENQEYNNEQLNTLVGKYLENRNAEDEKYEMEVEHKKMLARKETEAKKAELGIAGKKPEDDSVVKEKIDELREVANEKDAMIEDAKPKKDRQPAETLLMGDEDAPRSDIVEAAKKDVDPQKYADVWMQRQIEGTKEPSSAEEAVERPQSLDPSQNKEATVDEVISQIF